MGEAKRRGTFQQRKAAAIAEGRIKRDHIRRIKMRDFKDVFSMPAQPKEQKQQVLLIGGTPVHMAIKGIVKANIKQPGYNRKEHKPIPSL